MSSPVSQLRRRRLGVVHIVFFTVAASAPLTVLGGGVTTTFAVTGITGVPLSFLILAVALAPVRGRLRRDEPLRRQRRRVLLLSRPRARRHVGRSAGSFVALISYNAIQIGLYGLFGAALGDLVNQTTGVSSCPGGRGPSPR